MERLTPRQAQIIRHALIWHDGATLLPDFPGDEQVEITEALDVLRGILFDISELKDKQRQVIGA